MLRHDTAIYCGKPVREYTGRFPLVLSKETGTVEIKKYPTGEHTETESRKEASVEFK